MERYYNVKDLNRTISKAIEEQDFDFNHLVSRLFRTPYDDNAISKQECEELIKEAKSRAIDRAMTEIIYYIRHNKDILISKIPDEEIDKLEKYLLENA